MGFKLKVFNRSDVLNEWFYYSNQTLGHSLKHSCKFLPEILHKNIFLILIGGNLGNT